MFRLRNVWTYSLCLLLVGFIGALPWVQHAHAHAYSASYTTLDLTKTSTEMTYALDELSVIELVGGDLNKNGMLEQDEFEAVKDNLVSVLQQHLTLKLNNQTQSWKLISIVLDRQGDATKAIMKVSYPPVGQAQPVSLTDRLYMDDAATNYVDLVTIHYGKQKSTSALSGKNRVWAMQMTDSEYAGLGSPAQALNAAETNISPTGNPQEEDSSSEDVPSGWLSFFELGIHHILGGYDHLLFLFSLLIARQSFRQYATMITAFTIAHSITLSLTVLGYIHVPAEFVEPAIALSICYVALDNVLRKQVKYRWLLTFLFGLIHGMGFADILKEMDIPRSTLAVDLISFNLGIEAVQVTLVAILLPLLALVHRWKYARRFILTGSTAAFAMGGIWLVERLFFG